jgi:hypothetical protein
MFQINDALDAVLLGCFFFGLLFSLVSLLVGGDGIGPDLGGEGDGGSFLPVNLSTLLAFVAWFGGVGFIVRNAGGWPVAAALATGVVGGLLGAFVVARIVSTFVSPKGAVLDPADYRLPGTIARVTSSIRAGGVGEVVYEQGGVRQVSAARSESGLPLARGEEVVVLRSVGGVAFVEPSATFFADRDADAAVTAGTRPAAAMHPESR